MLPISFEFYPPKTDEQREQLDRTVEKLKAHSPQFMSVTFGAGGSTLSHTPETVQRLRSEHRVAGVPPSRTHGRSVGPLLRRFAEAPTSAYRMTRSRRNVMTRPHDLDER